MPEGSCLTFAGWGDWEEIMPKTVHAWWPTEIEGPLPDVADTVRIKAGKFADQVGQVLDVQRNGSEPDKHEVTINLK